jgi:hypothetical protein
MWGMFSTKSVVIIAYTQVMSPVYSDDSNWAGKQASLIAKEKGWIFCSSLFTIATLWDLP